MPAVSALAARPVVADALGYHRVTTTKVAATWSRYVTAPQVPVTRWLETIDNPRQWNARPPQSGTHKFGHCQFPQAADASRSIVVISAMCRSAIVERG
ncbi:hypothetical protein [Nocardia sp. CA-119907]|uniref:hypothetical protein n=1 Tax=Nocardia sp. CA-119907 TaxID=3239973 RepID=UPI003D99CB8A